MVLCPAILDPEVKGKLRNMGPVFTYNTYLFLMEFLAFIFIS